MSKPAVIFDSVWKKFQRGERHDSFRDLVPAAARRLFRRQPSTDDLKGQEFWAVHDVSFEVHPGEALGIIGPNGAGKSTTLKLLTKILRPTKGRCHIEGRVGALIEVAAGFHPDLTGRENVFLQGAIMGMKRAEVAAQFDEIIDFAGVSSFVDTPVKRYSSGMNARLGFSVAAHLNPDVLIIDEVLAVGDGAFQEKCAARMEHYLRRGAAIVFVSHNLAAVTQLCERVLLLGEGRVITTGPAAQTIAAYCTAQEASGGRASSSSDPVSITAHLPDRPNTPMWLVEPGQRIRVDVEIGFRAAVECAAVGVVIWDIARNLYVYGVTADAIGLPLLRGSAGDSEMMTFDFATNLARGTYVIEINVSDPSKQSTLGVLKPAAQFTVVENVTYGGIANLFLAGRHVETRELV